MKTLHPVDAYAAAVISGRTLAGPLVRLACERHVRDRRSKRWTFDVERADHILRFFSDFLRLPDTLDADGEPVPFVLAPFWQFIVGSLFGWVGSDGYRRFRDGYIEGGKGSAKTPTLAGVGLYGLTMDGERAAEIYAAASDRYQAGHLFQAARRMVEVSPALASRVQVHVGNLAYEPSMSFFRPFSREQGAKSGAIPHICLIDEIHEHPDAAIVNKMRAGVKRRRQPLVLEITNSGHDRTSICWEHHEHARRVVEQATEDDRFFGFVMSMDEGDDPLTDPTCWPKTNPLLGITPSREYLEQQVLKAKSIPSETNTVLQLNFCMWTQSSKRWLDMAQWRQCGAAGGHALPSDEELRAVPCCAGLDLGQTDDFTALARVWRLPDGRVVVKMRYWLPELVVQKTQKRPYAVWERSGLLTQTPGDRTDYQQVEDDILELHDDQPIVTLGYDPKFASQLSQRLQGAGIDVLPVKQGFALNEQIREIETLVGEGRLLHGDDPILWWMVDNVVATIGREGDKRFDKQRSSEKIDGASALATGLAALALQDGGSVYEERGFLTL